MNTRNRRKRNRHRFPSVQRKLPGRSFRPRKWKTLETLGNTGLMSLICLTTTEKKQFLFLRRSSLSLEQKKNQVGTGVNFARHFSDIDPADSIPLAVLVCELREVFSPGRCKTQARGEMGGKSFMKSHEECTRCVRKSRSFSPNFIYYFKFCKKRSLQYNRLCILKNFLLTPSFVMYFRPLPQ